MASMPRMTLPTQLVLRTLLDQPTKAMYGLEIIQASGLASGTVHQILTRFEKIGWLESTFEEIDPHREGRPRRRYYRLSRNGAELARHALAAAHTSVNRIPTLRPQLFPGGSA
jgi:DNA-binding PadR family transcriptional regulator